MTYLEKIVDDLSAIVYLPLDEVEGVSAIDESGHGHHGMYTLTDTSASDGPRFVSVMHPSIYRIVYWFLYPAIVRRQHREAGYPFGRNQGAVKRWWMTR